jgi:mannose-1-phosphate guanylyltransferase
VIAVVLVGGEGTRLQPLTLDRPKPVLPIGGVPFAALMIDRLAAAGVTRVILSCGYLPDVLRAELGATASGVDIDVVVEDVPLGTGGAIRFAAEGRVEGPFLALNGDVLGDADLAALVRAHAEHDARATIGLTPVDDPTRFGVVLHDEAGRVSAFVEKPATTEGLGPAPYWVNAGAYVLDPSVLELIPTDRMVSIERDVFPLLTGGVLRAHRDPGYWRDIGTLETFLAANADAIAGVVGTRIGGAEDLVRVAADATVDPAARLVAPVLIGPGASVGAAAEVGPNVVLGDGAAVGAGARVRDAVLFDRALVGDDATVATSVLGSGAVVGERASLRGSALGTDQVLGSGSTGTDLRLPSSEAV